MYAICIAQPGAGKSQVFRLSIVEPLNGLKSSAVAMMVDDYTRQGLFKHLRECGGRAYVAQEEMTAFFDSPAQATGGGWGETAVLSPL